MPVLFLTEEDVRQLLTMELALEAVELGLRKLALDEASNIPRARAQTDHASKRLPVCGKELVNGGRLTLLGLVEEFLGFR